MKSPSLVPSKSRATLALAGLLSACSAEVEPAAADPFTGPLTAENFVVRVAAARCAADFTCRDALSAMSRSLFANEAECVTEARTQENTPIEDDLVALARASTVRFDAAEAQRCIDETARTCTDFGFSPSACKRAFRGRTPVGGTCWRHEECADDAWCDHERVAGATANCPGTCRARAALGAPCGPARCADTNTTGSAFCFGRESPRCVDVQTGPSADEGQPCGMHERSNTLVVRTRCRDGFACIDRSGSFPRAVTTEGTGICERLPRVGEACQALMPGCGDDAQCIGGVCTRTSVQPRVGDPCDPDGVGPRYCSPVRYLTCVNGTCQRLGDGSLGSRCTRFCQRGLTCVDDVCRPLGAPGETCRFGDQCASGSCDDPNPFEGPPGRCRPRYCSW